MKADTRCSIKRIEPLNFSGKLTGFVAPLDICFFDVRFQVLKFMQNDFVRSFDGRLSTSLLSFYLLNDDGMRFQVIALSGNVTREL